MDARRRGCLNMAPPELARDIPSKDYSKYGFSDPEKYIFKSKKGLDEETVRMISRMKKEPEWMLKFRLRALKFFWQKPLPMWGADLTTIDFDNIYYYINPSEKRSQSWDDVPVDIKNTFERLGIPEAERKFLGGVGAQYESEVVYHKIRKDLEDKGVIFLGMDQGLADHPDM